MVTREMLDLMNYVLAKLPRTPTQAHDGVLFEGGKATQSDKPSPHSSYELRDLWVRARKAFPAGDGEIHVWEVANTNSMEPLFDDNCQVITEDCTVGRLKLQPLRAGDIVIYEAPNGMRIIHRLQRKMMVGQKVSWQIGGDNNYFPDGFVPEDRVRERMVGILYGRQQRDDD